MHIHKHVAVQSEAAARFAAAPLESPPSPCRGAPPAPSGRAAPGGALRVGRRDSQVNTATTAQHCNRTATAYNCTATVQRPHTGHSRTQLHTAVHIAVHNCTAAERFDARRRGGGAQQAAAVEASSRGGCSHLKQPRSRPAGRFWRPQHGPRPRPPPPRPPQPARAAAGCAAPPAASEASAAPVRSTRASPAAPLGRPSRDAAKSPFRSRPAPARPNTCKLTAAVGIRHRDCSCKPWLTCSSTASCGLEPKDAFAIARSTSAVRVGGTGRDWPRASTTFSWSCGETDAPSNSARSVTARTALLSNVRAALCPKNMSQKCFFSDPCF